MMDESILSLSLSPPPSFLQEYHWLAFQQGRDLGSSQNLYSTKSAHSRFLFGLEALRLGMAWTFPVFSII